MKTNIPVKIVPNHKRSYFILHPYSPIVNPPVRPEALSLVDGWVMEIHTKKMHRWLGRLFND